MSATIAARWPAAIALGTSLWLAATLASAGGTPDCGSLPTQALRPRTCNPQHECLKLQRKRSDAGRAEVAQRDCARLPTSGFCYGADTYNPLADCRARQKSR